MSHETALEKITGEIDGGTAARALAELAVRWKGRGVVAFDLAGNGLGDQMTRTSGIPAIDLTAAGAVAGNALTLDRAQARGAGGLSLDAQGTVPFTGSGLDLRWQAPTRRWLPHQVAEN